MPWLLEHLMPRHLREECFSTYQSSESPLHRTSHNGPKIKLASLQHTTICRIYITTRQSVTGHEYSSSLFWHSGHRSLGQRTTVLNKTRMFMWCSMLIFGATAMQCMQCEKQRQHNVGWSYRLQIPSFCLTVSDATKTTLQSLPVIYRLQSNKVIKKTSAVEAVSWNDTLLH